ncbi:SRPBCC family protein [Massilia sp. PWRC2]|uniref:SRPBCC family protein n=1 Tax=Massilia sp. PWRC2 TaxID=2804626 RepID=UPI003CED4E60
MPVTIEAGRRSVHVSVEVPGTPQEVWRAIASGPGISSWFVPTAFEEVDGTPVAVQFNFGPGMAPRSAITAWQPPHAFTVQGDGWGGSPPIASQWRVEAGADGHCTVHVINSMLTEVADWDAQLDATAQGWPAFFRTLQLYLRHFRGQPASLLQLVVPVAGSAAQAWQALCTALGLHDITVGQPWQARAGVPTLGGVVEYLSEDPYDALLRLAQPGPGVAAFGAFNYGGQSMVAINVYHYGAQAQAALERERPRWQAWLATTFAAPPATPASAAG